MPRRLAQRRMTLSDLEWPFMHRVLSLRYLSFRYTGKIMLINSPDVYPKLESVLK